MTVVMLISDKRSGSTMFEETICSHPSIQHVTYTPHTFRETHHFNKGAVLLGMNASLHTGHTLYKGYGGAQSARTYLIDGVRGNVPDFTPPADHRELIFKGWEALCERFAQPIFFEKSPQHITSWGALSLILEWIERTRHDVRIIGLVRNPLSVSYSARETFRSNDELRQYAWLSSQRNLLAFRQMLPPGTYHQIRYEDLVDDPAGRMQEIFEFVGAPAPADWTAPRPIDRASLFHWRNDPSFGVQLATPVRQMARHLGYPDADLDNPTFDPALVRQRERELTGLPNRVRTVRNHLVARTLKPLALRLGLKSRHHIGVERAPWRTPAD